jgi:hypothetical protein
MSGVIFRRGMLRGNKFDGSRPSDSQDGETLGLAEPRTRCVAFIEAHFRRCRRSHLTLVSR